MSKTRLILVGTVIWIALAAMSLWFLGVWPRTAVGWLLVFVLGPLAVLLLDAAAEMLGSAFASLPGVRHADLVLERRTASRQLSGARVAYYLGRALLILVPIVLGLMWLEGAAWPTVPKAFAQWWLRHFN